ncbi:winged helix-turn-helix domain-containing protein [Granulicella sp. dw_53]|uniref:winged helix-turn-helix domain-containing protein n=1 Tax=Granulicella sp. dw_53 TaxID=2719792 RepID=UPI002103AC9F|nr:winged helix-turn-helix domain-containing protein [Granulicella sp. dw_53]
MERTTTTLLRIGAWCVNPAAGEISRDGESVRLEARTMRLLLCLAEHAGEVVSIDTLLEQAWSGVTVSTDSVYQAVASLRRLLGDDPKQPVYIATVPRLGYRMVAAVRPWADSSVAQAGTLDSASEVSDMAMPISRPLRGVGFVLAGVAVICFVGVVVLFVYGVGIGHRVAPSAFASQPAKSIAVLPFLDLTEGMNEEPFADGMTEELIDKLSKVPGLRVPGPTSSFYFKGKLVPVGEIAKALGVAYVLDGSVRKSGGRLRVAARLIRADNGFVVWTESYDRPFDDILMVQDDIAGEVTKALRTSSEFKGR